MSRNLLIVTDIRRGKFFKRLFRYAKQDGFNVKVQKYANLLSKPVNFPGNEISIFFFFPHKFWNKYCEKPFPGALYGISYLTYLRFRKFWLELEAKLEEHYSGKKLEFLIQPKYAFPDRDKMLTRSILKKKGLPVTEILRERDLESLINYIEDERGVFIKARYGGEGKGITYLSRKNWLTNYRVDGDKLTNPKNENWIFTNITGKANLVNQLLKNNVIIEKEIISNPNAQDKIDFRAYVVFDEVPHIFIRKAPKYKIITNWSRGGEAIHTYSDVLKREEIEEIKRLALEAARAMNCETFCGVDIIPNTEGFVVLETQAFTGFPNPDYFDLTKYIIKKMKNGRT